MPPEFVVCVGNEGHEVSLEIRKIYAKIPDPTAEKHGQIRIVDESGEDYLFPAMLFAEVQLPAETLNKILKPAA